jgi:hypothetical protein
MYAQLVPIHTVEAFACGYVDAWAKIELVPIYVPNTQNVLYDKAIHN